MQFEKSCIEFEVTSLDEVKVLIRSRNQVLAHSQKIEIRAPRLTENHLININLDDRQRPEELVVLQFLGPPDLCDKLVAELKAGGYACPVIKAIEGLWTRYRLHADQH
jgi:hypothetical protein